MAFLTPCDTCRRHVLSTESACPFCGASVTSAMRARLPRAPAERLGRAAMMLLGASVATTACGSGDESRDTGQPASSSSQTTNGNGTATAPNASATGTMMAMPSDPSGPSGTPTTIAEPEPFAVAAYGVAILEPDGRGGAPNLDPPPAGQGGTGADPGPVMEPEPTFMALYGAPVVEPERVEPEPDVDAEVDAGAAEPEPQLEPEPMAGALYGVSPLPADRDRP